MAFFLSVDRILLAITSDYIEWNEWKGRAALHLNSMLAGNIAGKFEKIGGSCLFWRAARLIALQYQGVAVNSLVRDAR
jgi:hypothetical protein